MSSDQESEVGCGSTQVVETPNSTSVSQKSELSGGVGGGSSKKTVYTRKKSTSAMQRKISAELGSKTVASPTAAASDEDCDKETEEESDSGPSVTNKSASEKYLNPRAAAHPKHRHQNSSSLRKHVLVRRSPSPSTMSPGYEQYQMAFLEVPLPRDYGEASSDDLSSEWDSDAPDSRSRFLGNFKVKRVYN